MFFDKLGGGAGMGPGMGGGASAFMSPPGGNPQSLAALMAMKWRPGLPACVSPS